MGFLRNLRTAVLKPGILVQYVFFHLARRFLGRPPTLPMPKGMRLHPAGRFNDYRSVYIQRPGEQELRLVASLLPKINSTIVDVGANVGAFTMLASSTGSAGRIIAFEPAHRYCQAFHANMVSNGVRGVSLVQAAVSDTPGIANFREDPALPLHGKFDAGILYSSDIVSVVSTVRLDETLQTFGIAEVDLLKVDVEGAEPSVIRGARALLEHRKIGAIYLEFIVEHMEDMGENPKDFVEAIVQHGYDFHEIMADGSIGRLLDHRKMVDERRVPLGAPNRPWNEINILILRRHS
ncbi:FkbM family methyltransferase [Altererythrobacter sp. GH1-8]|uniref:FkbM family methyltransferase n=1 Tax=Altererythrobacter sp. GH1-8 TaxID=3349333 RepID=UPI00374D334A